jgi:hypothetical protein
VCVCVCVCKIIFQLASDCRESVAEMMQILGCQREAIF